MQVESKIELELLEKYLKTKVEPNLLKWDKDATFCSEVFKVLHETGFMAYGIPTECGGRSAAMVDLLAISRLLASYSPGVFTGFIGNLLGQTAIYRFGSEDLRQRVLRQHLEEKSLLSFCVTEAETGTDVGNMVTTCQRQESGFLLNGGKHYITNLNHAKHYVVMARAPDHVPSITGLTAFYVPAETPGIVVGKPLQKLGHREADTGYMSLENVFVPATNLLGRVGDGQDVLATCISRTKTLIAGASVGICDRAHLEAVAYLSTKQRYGKPLLVKKEIQMLLAELHTKKEAAWLLACQAGDTWDREGIAVKDSSMAKFYAGNLATDYVSTCLELCGASGYMEENILSKLYRDAKLMSIYEGASLVQLAFVAKTIFATPAKATEAAQILSLKRSA